MLVRVKVDKSFGINFNERPQRFSSLSGKSAEWILANQFWHCRFWGFIIINSSKLFVSLRKAFIPLQKWKCKMTKFFDLIFHLSTNVDEKLSNRSKNSWSWKLISKLPTIQKEKIFYIWNAPANLKIELKSTFFC